MKGWNKNTKIKNVFFIIVIALIGCLAWNKYYRQQITVKSFVFMDTNVDIALLKRDKKLYPKIVSYAKVLTEKLNVFSEDSCVTLLNREHFIPAGHNCYPVLREVVVLSKKICGATSYMFDPGYKKGISVMKIDVKDDGIYTPKGSYYDFSGIAKGFIVDKLVDMAISQKVKFIMINAGGDIRVYDGYGIGVSVRIKNPYGKDFGKVILKDGAIATSGEYERGKHIFDPKTGKAVNNNLVSVSAVSRLCAIADGWATASFVGEEKILSLADRNDVAIMLVRCIDNNFVCETNDFWSKRVSFQDVAGCCARGDC